MTALPTFHQPTSPSPTVPVAASPATGTPVSVLVAARIGGTIALLAAAAISFHAIADLGRQVGLGHLANLLPTAVDAFAGTTLFIAYRLPEAHPALRTAARTARLALAMTVGCNALDHVLVLAGYLLPPIVKDLLLIAVAPLPAPFIVERLLHLQTALVCGTNGEDVDAERSVDDRSEPPTHFRNELRPSDEYWLTIATPVYKTLLEGNDHRPTERAFHAALTDTLAVQTVNENGNANGQNGMDGMPRPLSLSTAKRVRALVEANENFSS